MKKLVVLTGSGISAESGISTFRDSGGLWEQHRIEDVATPEAWNRNQDLVHKFYNLRREQLLNVVPNNAHYGLVELEKYFNVQIITQNVDNLHERAGSKQIVHLHGELMKVRSTGPGQEIFELNEENVILKKGDLCPKGFQLRPHIVWFGEAVPEIEHAIEIVEEADILVIIGTSLQVYPAAGLVNYTKPGVPVYLIDPNDVDFNNSRINHIKLNASQGVDALKLTLLSEM